MRKNLWMLAVILICGSMTMLTSCSIIDNPADNNEQTVKNQARITETIRHEKKKATVYNIEYPSTDPFGKPVTLSGSIIIGDEVEDDGKKAAGMVLYNHFTVFQKDECPSRGDVGVPMVIVGSKMIAVAPDYYGFGVTGDKNQAYCISRANAQASVDALIAARELLKEKGYTWGDLLFNAGIRRADRPPLVCCALWQRSIPTSRSLTR